MKLIVAFLASARPCAASLLAREHELFLKPTSGVEVPNSFVEKNANPSEPASGAVTAHYGDTACPCIGFDGLSGEQSLELEVAGKRHSVFYPKDMGSHCSAWDLGRHPRCQTGDSPEWCAEQWCFVDSCNCHINVIPEMSTYLPKVTYRGKPLFYSFATCHGEDHFNKQLPEFGSPGCRCVGFHGAAGTMKVKLSGGDVVEYPGSLGGTCSAWDSDVHPDCAGDHPPAWCKAQWCYVDACACKLPDGHVPKISAYLPDATFTGKAFYYSYETCKSKDTWTKKHHPTACVNQATEQMCDTNPRCAWTGARCLGKELVSHPLCEDMMDRVRKSAAPGRAPSAAVLAAAVAGAAAVVASAMH